MDESVFSVRQFHMERSNSFWFKLSLCHIMFMLAGSLNVAWHYISGNQILKLQERNGPGNEENCNHPSHWAAMDGDEAPTDNRP